jgi:oligopeptide/dipeptide ABC transporter ATP-binding protein
VGLNPKRTAMSSGQALWKGKDLLTAPPARLREIRGNEIAMIFQDPMTSLNPVHRISDQLGEAMRLHSDVSKKHARARALELLKAVGIPRAERRLDDYPHQFSGGMRQRVMIAMALVNNPDLLIADEPTTALDVTIQAQILEVLQAAQQETQAATIMITHDLGLIAEMADRVVVMYAGHVVETGDVDTIFHDPRHPYTLGLMGSLPDPEAQMEWLRPIPGQPPSLINVPPGCPFHPRCPLSKGREICRTELPPLESAGGPGHLSACHFKHELEGASDELLKELEGTTT